MDLATSFFLQAGWVFVFEETESDLVMLTDLVLPAASRDWFLAGVVERAGDWFLVGDWFLAGELEDLGDRAGDLAGDRAGEACGLDRGEFC